MEQSDYNKYSSLANKLARRAKKVALINLDDASQVEVDSAEQDFYFALMKLIAELSESYEHDPRLNSVIRTQIDKEKIMRMLESLL